MGPLVRIEGGSVFPIGPFEKTVFTSPTLTQTLFYTDLPKSDKDKTDGATALQFLPDFGKAFLDDLLAKTFEAVATYAYHFDQDNFAIVFERTNEGRGRRVGLLRLAAYHLRKDGMAPVYPSRSYTCDVVRVFGAKPMDVCLE